MSWFEEPVSSADFEGLRLVREQGPGGLEIAAGEYAYVLADFRSLLGCVDCMQVDVTRCGGITGLLQAAGLANAHGLDLSGHCAPQLSAHALLRRAEPPAPRVLPRPRSHRAHALRRRPRAGGGELKPDRSRPGLGLELRRADAERYAA